jgi:hypothetical protein
MNERAAASCACIGAFYHALTGVAFTSWSPGVEGLEAAAAGGRGSLLPLEPFESAGSCLEGHPATGDTSPSCRFTILLGLSGEGRRASIVTLTAPMPVSRWEQPC